MAGDDESASEPDIGLEEVIKTILVACLEIFWSGQSYNLP